MGLKVKSGSQGFLKKYVLDEGLCTGCGACVNICPYQVLFEDRTVQLHPCDLTDGHCFAYCPRTQADGTALRELLFESADLTEEIGAVKGYYFSQAADPELRKMAQHGGTVTALLELALAEGLIDSAIVSSPDGEFLQNGVMVKDKTAIRNNAKSKFTVSPMVAAFNQLVAKEAGKVGVVATPCQALALAKMKINRDTQNENAIDQLNLVIGLYCGWTLSWEKFTKLLLEQNIALESVIGMDIPAGKNALELFIYNGGVQSIPFDRVQTCIRDACNYCVDSTAEYADVSVGSARFAGSWDEVRQWNQLIVRTNKGKELVDLAMKKGVLCLREAPLQSLKELKEAAVGKKKNALNNIVRKSGSIKNLLYLDGRDPVVKKYLIKGKSKN